MERSKPTGSSRIPFSVPNSRETTRDTRHTKKDKTFLIAKPRWEKSPAKGRGGTMQGTDRWRGCLSGEEDFGGVIGRREAGAAKPRRKKEDPQISQIAQRGLRRRQSDASVSGQEKRPLEWATWPCGLRRGIRHKWGVGRLKAHSSRLTAQSSQLKAQRGVVWVGVRGYIGGRGFLAGWVWRRTLGRLGGVLGEFAGGPRVLLKAR